MRVFRRIGDILSANLNELVDSCENPEVMLKQAIREMEQSIESATQETAKVLANSKRLAKELKQNESEASRWQQEAEKAIDAGDDDLARRSLVRKQERENIAIALRDQHAPLEEVSQSLIKQLDGMKAKMAEAKRSLATLAARRTAAEARKKLQKHDGVLGGAAASGKAFEKFERMRDKVEQAEAEAEAMAELRRSDSTSDAADLNRSDIDAQLSALKLQRKQAE